ncbi:MAG TPA: polysaccharide biosynthesis/export family protein [Bryobacteraceae bacterium]|nr:polysaccharide biosynthesis/export family protein [Bryobacteraceae bacterium]
MARLSNWKIPAVLKASLFGVVSCLLLAAADPQTGGEPAATVPQKDAQTQPADTVAKPPTPRPDSNSPVPGLPAIDPLKNAKTNSLGEKIVGGSPITDNAYVVGAEDVLAVSVWHEQELSRPVIVRPDGKITLPLVGEITAAGLTLPQLTAVITAGLKKFLLSPEVSVSVQAVNSKKYYIQGEVLRPGAYPLVVPTTVMEGLANAGGFRDFANLRKITILRGTERLRFNYKEVRSGKHLEQNILLQPGDQIIVP